MTHLVDSILAAVRTELIKGLTVNGHHVAITRLPEIPVLALETDKAQYPMICLDVGQEANNDGYRAGKVQVVSFDLTLEFVAHRDGIAAVGLTSPYEYSRKGAAAIDTALSGLGSRWGVTGVIHVEWRESRHNENASNPEEGLWVWSTTWSVVYAAG